MAADEGWRLDGEGPVIEAIGSIPYDAVPFINDPKAWDQWSDPVYYQLDKDIRDFIGKMSENKAWRSSRNRRKYTVGMLFEILYGRKWDPKKDNKYAKPMSRILSYYSTRIQSGGSVGGKMTSKSIYTLSHTRLEKPPYSLKLRFEKMAEDGVVPNRYNMRLPKDNLKPGHARNPRTEKNMERRREEAKRKYAEKYKDRDH